MANCLEDCSIDDVETSLQRSSCRLVMLPDEQGIRARLERKCPDVSSAAGGDLGGTPSVLASENRHGTCPAAEARKACVSSKLYEQSVRSFCR